MNVSNELRVGIMFIVGLILLVLVIVTLTNWGQTRNTYSFSIRFMQAQGIQEGAQVRVAGVEVGRVTAIALEPRTNEALVTVNVDQRVCVYRNYDYIIGMAGLVGERFVDIRPKATDIGACIKPGEEVPGTVVPDINDVVANANVLVGKLQTTVDGLNSVVGDPATQANIKKTMANLNATTANAATLTNELNQMLRRNSRPIDAIVANLEDVSVEVRRVGMTLSQQLTSSDAIENVNLAARRLASLTGRLDGIAGAIDTFINDEQLSKDVHATVVNLRNASGNLESLTNDTREAIAGVPRITEGLQQASADLPKITGNIERASADLPEITRPLREVAPETAENIRQLSIRLRNVSENIGGLVGRASQAGEVLSTLRVQPEVRLMGLPDGTEDSRSDMNLDIRTDKALFRAGVADLGHASHLNLQFGNRLGSNLWMRYGVVESRLGVGADYNIGRDLRLTGEVFDPEDVRANALLDWRLRPLGNSLWLSGGYFNLFGNRQLGLGLTYRPE